MAKHILIVDDSTIVRKLLAEIIEKEGYQPVESATVANGLNKLKDSQFNFGLVFLDLVFREGSGLDLLAALPKTDHAELPVVLISTEAEKNKVVEALQLGARDFIHKPFSIRQIQQRIRRFIPTSKGA